MKSRRNLFLGTLVVIALSHAAQATVGTWSGTTTATWDTSATNWTGVTGTPWDVTNGPANTATFNLASLAATVSGTVHTNGITFTTGGSLTGGVVTLAGTTPSISVATGQTGTLGTTDLAGSAGLIKTGDGILSLGSAKTLTGGVTVNAGTLRFTTNGGVGANAINLGDTSGSTAATLEWVNNTTATSTSPVTVRSGSAGTKTLQVTSAVSATISSLTLQDNVTKTNAGDLNVTNATNLDGASRTITVNSGRLLLNGAVGETSGTGFNLTKDGAATLVLAGTNTYTGTTTTAGGVLQVNKALALPGYNTAGKAIINGGTLSVQVGGSGWTTTEVDTLLTNATKTSGKLGIDTTNANLIQWTAFNDANLSATIGLEKLGSNSLTLNLTNTYTGNTTVTAGTLQPNDIAALPGYNTSGKIIFNGGTLNILTGGSNWSTSALDTLLANATKTSGSIGIDTTNGNLDAWATPFSGSIGLTKNGNNRLTLSVANTFTGGVTVNAGTLRIAHSSALGSGSKTLSSQGGSRVVELFGGVTLPSSVSLTMSSNSGDGAGLTTSDGVNTIQGNISYSSGNPALNISSFTGGTLNIQGNITLSIDATTRNLTLGGTSTALNTISGVIGHTDTATRILPVLKQSAGTWVLSGTNTYTGLTTISGGTLVAQNNSALGKTTGATTVNGGTLDLGGTLGGNALNLGAEVITISGSGVGTNGALVNNGSNDQTNAVQKLVLGANATVGGTKRWDVRGSGNTFNMAGFTLTKKGTNIVALVATTISNPGNIDVVEGVFGFHTTGALPGSATNTLTVRSGASADFYSNPGSKLWTMVLEDGKVTTSNGTNSNWAGPGSLAGTTGGTFDIASGQAFIFNGNIGESATGKQLVKSGAGTLTLAGTNNFTGATTVTGGTLKLDYTTNDTTKLDDLAALNLAGATIDLNAGTHPEIVGSVNLLSGASSVTRAAGTAVLQMNAITPSVGTSINFGADSIASTDTPNTNGILGPWATVTAVGGTTWAVNSTDLADGPITGLATYTLSSVAGDTATNYAGANISIDSNQILDAAATPNSLRFNNLAANTLTLTGTNTIGSGGVLVTSTVGNNLSIIETGSITGPANGDFVINQQNTANSLRIDSDIVNNGTTNLVKLGLGRAILTGNNTYSGTTTIGAGPLQIDNAASLGTSTAISVSGFNNSALVLGNDITAGLGKTVTIRGGGLEGLYGGISTSSTNTSSKWEGNVVIGDLPNTRIGSRGGSLEISGIISEAIPGSGFIVRSALNDTTVIFSGNNTFTGPLTVSNNGTLTIRHANALGTTAGGTTIGNNTTLMLEGGLTFAAEPLNLTGGGFGDVGALRNFSGDNTCTGTITLDAQSRISSSADTLTLDVASGPAITATNQNVIFSGDGNILVKDPITTGTGTLTKLGVGILTLSADNTYTGVTSFQEGITNVASLTDYGVAGPLGARTSAQELAANIGLRFAGGTLQYTGSTAQSTNRQIRIGTAGGTIDASGSSPGATLSLTHSGANTDLFDSPGSRTLTLTGTNAGDNTFAIGLQDQAANPTSLTKAGSGKWILTNTHTYTGNTSVDEGTLTVASTGALRFKPTTNGNNNTLTVASSSTVNFNGTLSIDLTTADPTPGNTWNLVDQAALSTVNFGGTFAVTSTTLGAFAETSPGVWKITAGPNDWTFTETTGDLTYGPSGSDYNTWGTPYGLTTGSENGDLDGDGLTNFQEYAFGLIPDDGSSVNPITQPLDKTTGVFKYTRRATPATTGVSYTYESSTTLSGAWNPVTPAVPPTSNGGSPVEEITVTLPGTPLSDPKFFIRVMAVKP